MNNRAIETNVSDDNLIVKRALWIALLTGATILSSFAFACATPFAALAALAALRLRSRDAFALTALNWGANQIIGYGILHYPQTWDSFAWGAAIGLAAMAATAIAIRTENASRSFGGIAAALCAFAAAFVAYELSLYAATAVLPAEPSAFGANVVAYLAEVNGIVFAGLLALCAFGRYAGFAVPRCAPST